LLQRDSTLKYLLKECLSGKLLAMEFSRDQGNATYKIKSYHEGRVTINDQVYSESLIIMPEQLTLNWEVRSINDLTLKHFQQLAELKPEVVIIGAGDTTAYVEKNRMSPLLNKGIGVEIMSVASACRTYTILMTEGRNVAAGLILMNV
jgi:uncharacterized protein